MVDGRQVGRVDDGARLGIDQVEVERRDAPVVVADDELVSGLVDRQRGRAGGRERRQQVARHEVVCPDLGAGRDVEALAGLTVRRELVEPARFDGRGDDRHPELAGGVHLVVPERHDAGRHRVLGQVWVGPLVDVV